MVISPLKVYSRFLSWRQDVNEERWGDYWVYHPIFPPCRRLTSLFAMTGNKYQVSPFNIHRDTGLTPELMTKVYNVATYMHVIGVAKNHTNA